MEKIFDSHVLYSSRLISERGSLTSLGKNDSVKGLRDQIIFLKRLCDKWKIVNKKKNVKKKIKSKSHMQKIHRKLITLV
jgi:hypothetical protein